MSFKHGGLNDHVAITLQQKGIPYALVGEGFDQLESEVTHGQPVEPDVYTLACGAFKGEKGAYLWQGDRTELLKASMSVSATGADLPPLSSQPPAAIPDFADPGKVFFWLNGQNNRLLDYFAAGKVFDCCLSKKSVVSMSMAANRSEQVEILKQETERFLEDVDLLLSGYEKLLSFSQHQAASETGSIERSMEDLKAIKARFARLSNELKEDIEAVTSPFGDGELPEQGNSLQGWRDSCQKLSNRLQQLTPPKGVDEINSLHDIVFLVHSAFINALPAVCDASGLGEVTKVNDKIKLIDFYLSDQEGSKLNDNVKEPLAKLDCQRSTAVNLDGALILSADLGMHQCVIENIDQGEGGKGRTVRLKFSDAITGDGKHLKGKRRRMLLIALLIEAMSEKKPDVQLNTITGDLVIVHSHLENADVQEALFLNAVSVLFSLKDVDTVESMNGKYIDLSSINRRISEGLSSEENQKFLKRFLVRPMVIGEVTGKIRFQQLKADYRDAFEQGSWSYNNKDLVKSRLDFFARNDKANDKKKMGYLVAANPKKIIPIFINNDALDKNSMTAVLKSASAINHDVIKHIPGKHFSYNYICKYVSEQKRSEDKADITPETLQYEQLFQAVIKNDGSALASDRFIDVKMAVLAVVNDYGWYLMHVPDRFKDDKEVVLAAVKNNGLVLGFASDRLKDNKDVLLAAVKNKAEALEYASDRLKNDKEVVLAAVNNDGWALKFASDRLKNDKDVVLAAVKNNGRALEFASDRLKDDKDVVLAAAETNSFALWDASDRLKNDKEVVLAAVKKNGQILREATNRFKDDKEVILAAVNNDGWALKFASDRLKNDKDVVLAAVNNDGWALEFASDRLKNDKEVVLAAVKNNGRALEFASDRLKNDKDVVLAAVNNKGYVLLDVPNRLNSL